MPTEFADAAGVVNVSPSKGSAGDHLHPKPALAWGTSQGTSILAWQFVHICKPTPDYAVDACLTFAGQPAEGHIPFQSRQTVLSQ